MLYRIVGREVATHRRVEIPNWEAPNIAVAKRLATEIGIVVSTIEPMNAPTQEEQHEGVGNGRNEPTSDNDDSLIRGIPLKIPAAKAQKTEVAETEAPAPETRAASLINCPTCGKPISEAAQSCPGCGLPLTPDIVAAQRTKKQKAEQASALTVFGGLGVFMVFFLLCSGVFKSQPSSSSSPPSPVVETTVANKVATVDRHSDNPEYERRVNNLLTGLAGKYHTTQLDIANKACVARDILAKNGYQETLGEILTAVDAAEPGEAVLSVNEVFAAYCALHR